MRALLLGLVVSAFAFTPALAADDCMMRQAQVDKAFGKRFDKQATKVRSTALEGSRLCKAGKTKDGLMKYDQAAKEGGLMAGAMEKK
jgi:hypothetical protein